MGRDCNIDPSSGYGDFRKTPPVLVDSRFRLVLYHRELFQGQRSLRRLSLIEMAQDNDVLWSTEVGGSEDFFFEQYAEIGPQLRSQSIIRHDVRPTVRLGVRAPCGPVE
ncbi:MAG: hypothetical protein ABS70_03980 [Nitrospira sp. SCN 59-13]|nr:MAG: hypothetical protein ABS70_03980 [Nitrospira sp. SCN 59-13]